MRLPTAIAVLNGPTFLSAKNDLFKRISLNALNCWLSQWSRSCSRPYQHLHRDGTSEILSASTVRIGNVAESTSLSLVMRKP